MNPDIHWKGRDYWLSPFLDTEDRLALLDVIDEAYANNSIPPGTSDTFAAHDRAKRERRDLIYRAILDGELLSREGLMKAYGASEYSVGRSV